jgi:hypothetical protein
LSAPFQLQSLLERLIEAGVRFVVVGGLAVGAWGYVRGTKDVDVVPDPALDNLERLAAALRGLGGRVEVEEGLLTGDAILTFLKTGDRTLILTALGRVDVLQGSERPRDRDDLEALEAAQGGEDRRA